MKFTRYSKFNGLDIWSINLGDLMEGLSDSLLYSGYDDDYYWTRQQMPQDTSLDALRRALLQALMDQRLLNQHQIQQMLDENEGKYEGSQLQEMLNQLIERLVEEGYLTLHEGPQTEQRREMVGGNGEGRIEEPLPRNVKFEVTEKGLDFLGYKTLRNLLGSLGKSSVGRHDTLHLATGVEAEAASKPYEFGDTINLDVNTTLLSAIQREGLTVPLNLEYQDLHVHQCDYQSSCATVVMLDCSHSMILYGEDRFTPAKKVALALAHLIRTQYPGDSLKIVLFHDTAEELPLAKLVTTQVGPYHTNTAEGLRMARRILQAQRKDMKQIVMVTDGKPTACFLDGAATPVSAGRRHPAGTPSIMINTFMLASDYYLVEFVKQMSAMTNGKAYFANPANLSQFVLIDFLRRKKSKVK
ncbi:MAG: hypothetical protein DMF75_06695 [Acidobacteria bacterium]|nr:MAG: hypothetical protein DMF75_06695 [Acidobacteriota bacterium]